MFLNGLEIVPRDNPFTRKVGEALRTFPERDVLYGPLLGAFIITYLSTALQFLADWREHGSPL